MGGGNIDSGWITGWKSIAKYMGLTVSTAQSLHYDYGMPVYSLPTGTKVALPHELTEWLIIYNRKLNQ